MTICPVCGIIVKAHNTAQIDSCFKRICRILDQLTIFRIHTALEKMEGRQ